MPEDVLSIDVPVLRPYRTGGSWVYGASHSRSGGPVYGSTILFLRGQGLRLIRRLKWA